MTKTNVVKFNEVLAVLENAGAEAEAAFIRERIAMEEKRAENAKKARAKKAAEKSDELLDEVFAVLGAEAMTAADIADALNAKGIVNAKGEAITRNMVIARLTKLVKAGNAYKGKGKDEETKKVVTLYAGEDIFEEVEKAAE